MLRTSVSENDAGTFEALLDRGRVALLECRFTFDDLLRPPNSFSIVQRVLKDGTIAWTSDTGRRAIDRALRIAIQYLGSGSAAPHWNTRQIIQHLLAKRDQIHNALAP